MHTSNQCSVIRSSDNAAIDTLYMPNSRVFPGSGHLGNVTTLLLFQPDLGPSLAELVYNQDDIEAFDIFSRVVFDGLTETQMKQSTE